MYRVRAEVFDRVVAARLGTDRERPLRVLDVGSGTGFYVDRWLRRGAEVTGVDITAVAVERLRADFPSANFVQADIAEPLAGELASRAGGYDAVSAFDVLFHVVEDERYDRALANVSRLLRPGGWFLWSDNFLHGRTVRVEHQVSRSLERTGAALDRAGLTVEERVPMFVLMNYPADARTRLARWAWTGMVAPAVLSDRLGGALGAALYPIERRLVRLMKESPSTEVMVCRKPSVTAA